MYPEFVSLNFGLKFQFEKNISLNQSGMKIRIRLQKLIDPIVNVSHQTEAQKKQTSRVFLLRQIWLVNYYVKIPSKILTNENINIGVSVDFKTKRKSKCQNKLFFWKHPFFFSLLSSFDGIFDVIIDDPYLT